MYLSLDSVISGLYYLLYWSRFFCGVSGENLCNCTNLLHNRFYLGCPVVVSIKEFSLHLRNKVKNTVSKKNKMKSETNYETPQWNLFA